MDSTDDALLLRLESVLSDKKLLSNEPPTDIFQPSLSRCNILEDLINR